MSVAPDEHGYVLQPNWAAEGLGLLLWQLHKPRIEALVRALAAGAQLAEHTNWAVLVGAGLDAVEGETLDRWGELVGQRRGGLAHESLRTLLELRIRVNTEHPGEDAVGGVLSDAVWPSTVTAYTVADGIVYQVESAAFLAEALGYHAGALVRDFRPAGIYAAVVEFVTEDHFALDWETTGPLLYDDETSGGVIGRLLYGGR